jgi:hypothetical protein
MNTSFLLRECQLLEKFIVFTEFLRVTEIFSYYWTLSYRRNPLLLLNPKFHYRHFTSIYNLFNDAFSTAYTI